MRRTVTVFAALVLGLSAAVFVSCDKDPADAMTQARTLIEAEKLDEALALLEAARAEEGLTPRLAMGLGWIHEMNGDTSRAVMIYRECLEAGPSADVSLRLASIFLALDQTSAAIRQLESARENGASDLDVSLSLAVAYGRMQRYEDARVELERAEAAGAPMSAVHYNRGLLLRAEGRLQESHQSLLAALEQDSEDHNTLRELARAELLLAPGDPEAGRRAADHVNRSITISEAAENLDWRAYEVLGDCFMIERDWEAASAMFLKAKEVGKEPDDRLNDKYVSAQLELREELGIETPPDVPK